MQYNEAVEERYQNTVTAEARSDNTATKGAPAPKQESRNPQSKGPFGWLKDYATKLANNVRQIDIYGRLKDYYKLVEVFVPWIVSALMNRKSRRSRSHKDIPEWKSNDNLIVNALIPKVRNLFGLLSSSKSDELTQEQKDEIEKLGGIEGVRAELTDTLSEISVRDSENRALKRTKGDALELKTKLNVGIRGDAAFFTLQGLLSLFGAWAEKNQVMRVYGDLVSIEQNKPKSELRYKDYKNSDNPMIQDSAKYYGRKAWYRFLPDLVGLVRFLPYIIFNAQEQGIGSKNYFKVPEDKQLLYNKSSRVAGFLRNIAKHADGIKMLMGAKTIFFHWYFSSRQTGSFYEAKNIWNKTEGIAHIPNRALNENVQAGEFVTQQDIRSLYVNLREENPNMKLAEFTQDDPLASRIFDQTARYMNHTYMPRLYKMNAKSQQDDLPNKKLTHAMMTELMGTGGLRVEDAMGSVIRLEVMAYHGRFGVREGIKKYREVSKVLDKIKRPERTRHVTQEGLVQEVYDYLAKIDSIGREYLQDFWPPKYVDEDLKHGFIEAIFRDRDITQEQVEYMKSALFIRNTDMVETANTKHETLMRTLPRKEDNIRNIQPKQDYSSDLTRRDASQIVKHPESYRDEVENQIRA